MKTFKKVKGYEAADGRTFKSEQEARSYELELIFKNYESRLDTWKQHFKRKAFDKIVFKPQEGSLGRLSDELSDVCLNLVANFIVNNSKLLNEMENNRQKIINEYNEEERKIAAKPDNSFYKLFKKLFNI